jgi:hypothetical protein
MTAKLINKDEIEITQKKETTIELNTDKAK